MLTWHDRARRFELVSIRECPVADADAALDAELRRRDAAGLSVGSRLGLGENLSPARIDQSEGARSTGCESGERRDADDRDTQCHCCALGAGEPDPQAGVATGANADHDGSKISRSQPVRVQQLLHARKQGCGTLSALGEHRVAARVRDAYEGNVGRRVEGEDKASIGHLTGERVRALGRLERCEESCVGRCELDLSMRLVDMT